MSHIFISYSRKDKDAALNLDQRLKANLFPTFLDIHDIHTGEDWEKRIRSAVEMCGALVVILTPQSERSFWVMREVTYAQSLNKPVLPLMHNGYCFPLFEKLHCAASIDELIVALSRIEGLGRLMQLFVSHALADSAFVTRLVDDLTKLDAHIWQPMNSTTSQRDGLDAGQIMLLVVSPESMQSGEIRDQWKAFVRAGKTIIPILVQQVSVPSKLREIQPYIDFLNQSYQIAFGQLYGLLRSLGVSLKAHEQISIPPQPPLHLDGTDMLNEARQAIWIGGLTLDTYAQRATVLKRILIDKPEIEIRLLMLDLNVQLSNEVGAWTGINREQMENLPADPEFEKWAKTQEQLENQMLTEEGRWVAQRVYQNLGIFQALRDETSSQLQLHTVCFRLNTGYYIIDPYAEGILTAAPYFYRIDERKSQGTLSRRSITSPIFLSKQSSRENDQWWFDRYVQEFECLWQASTAWEPD